MATGSWDSEGGTPTSTSTGGNVGGHLPDHEPVPVTTDGHLDVPPPEDDPKAPPAEEKPEPPVRLSAELIARQLKYDLGVHLRDRQRALANGTAGTPRTSEPLPNRAVRRSVPVTIYLADGDEHQAVQQALVDLLNEYDFDVVDSLPPVRGSWYRAFVARTKDAVTSPGLKERARKVERGVELHLLQKQQAEIDSMQGDTVANLLTALAGTSDALIQIGSVLLVKVGGVPAVRNLTQQELIHLERNPQLLKTPHAILEALQDAKTQLPALVDQES